ncbi:TetR/AcrR family transcriptional regulator [Mycobacteroides salmoniphilum]|uniref:Fatty acid metabolism regulator protein n=1 Tax=Mycobacteroides salmoniphilum TaxID=404941 RepID=A0A4R8SMG5_9MYCO|nr:TetR/AcrR family transcriptional regulator [Mycobacteroides salmoniphilum]TDZ97909.1 Fatty acid metabolism regulator protein [Mycobacteroides salmoniphilum]TDZ99720.1 Fatty acid metabolism regulator protein [Mycobacteroides salmoniphilum]
MVLAFQEGASTQLQPRKQPRQDRADATRRRILDAAAHVFADFGYAAGTTNRIAEQAGVSIGSLYQYFPNKDSILVELMTVHTEEGFALVHRHLTAGLPDSIEDTLRVFVRAAIDNHRDNPRLHRVLFEEAPRPPEFLAMLHQSEDAVITAAEALLAKHPDVRVTETAMAARMVVATIESLVHRLVAGPRPVEPGPFEDQLVDMLTRYLTN